MKVPEKIAPEEELGRSVYSSRDAKRAARTRAGLNSFLEKEGEPKISTDRLSVAPFDEAIAIAETRGVARNRTFYGWAVVIAEQACCNGRRVVASPQPDNPYHGDIILPKKAVEDREIQKSHAQALADVSSWLSRPDLHDD